MSSDGPYLPTDEDVAFYREHGWWITPPVLSDEALDLLRHGVERYYAGERDTPLLTRLNTDWTEGDGDILRQNDYVSLQMDEFREFLEEAPLAAIAGRLSDATSIRLFHDQLVYKPAGAPARDAVVGWHTDRAYWQTCTSTAMLTAWIPLQDCSAEMGTLMVLDKSHTWPDNDDLKRFHTRDLEATAAQVHRHGQPWREVALEMKAGQVSFHHCRTIHGSAPNRATAPRLAWAVHYQDGDNRYQENRGPDGALIPHINDILCCHDDDGKPDYTDPAICPLLWTAAP